MSQVKIKLNDRYDYSEPKTLIGYYFDTDSIPKSISSSTLYNLASCSVKCKEYDIAIEINNYEVKEEWKKR